MAYFQNKNHNLDKFWMFLKWKMLLYYMAFWSIFLQFGILYIWHFGIFCRHLVYFPRLGVLYHKKSGNHSTNKASFQHHCNGCRCRACGISFCTTQQVTREPLLRSRSRNVPRANPTTFEFTTTTPASSPTDNTLRTFVNWRLHCLSDCEQIFHFFVYFLNIYQRICRLPYQYELYTKVCT
jgi:hypothetical protein